MQPANTQGVTALRRSLPLKSLGSVLALLMGLLAVLVLQVSKRGTDLMSQSDRHFDRGQLAEATEFAREAAAAYLPGAAHVDRAYGRLSAIATGAMSTGDSQTAIAAWSALRGVLIETQHPWSDTQPLLKMANTRLIGLLSANLEPAHLDQADAVALAYQQGRQKPPFLPVSCSIGAALMLFSVYRVCSSSAIVGAGWVERAQRWSLHGAFFAGLALWLLAFAFA